MSILFVGSMAEEFVNGNLVTTNAAAFDADYTFGALAVATGDNVLRMVGSAIGTATDDIWLHCIYYQTARQANASDRYLINVKSSAGASMFGIWDTLATSASTKLSCQNTNGTNVYSLLPIGKLVALDFHYTYNAAAGSASVQLYIDGLLAATTTDTTASSMSVSTIELGSLITASPAYFTEVMLTSAETTIGWRLSSMTASAAGSLSEWTGAFGDLADGDTATGIWTDQPNKRHTGVFSAYAGAANPLGVRALVQVGRFIENDSGLTLQGMLYRTASSLAYATYDANVVDTSRVITVWDTNPHTATDWTVDDFANFEGGFKSLAA